MQFPLLSATRYWLQVIPLNAATSALWEQLFDDFSEFEDLRKLNASQGDSGPDFRHKHSGDGLW